MNNSPHIKIDLDRVLYVLFCLYAFSVSFELVLEKLLFIDTVFKPFRVLSLIIIGTYFVRTFRSGVTLYAGEREDVFLYLVFVYGIMVSCVQVVINVFSISLFYSDLLLTGLHVFTFFIYKSLFFTKAQTSKILLSFVTGVVINGGYILYAIFFLKNQTSRQSGFIDNPNYAALGLVAVMAYLLLRSNFGLKFWQKFFNIAFLLFTLYIFIITGSRAGLAMFLLILLLLFAFSSLRRKFVLLIVGAVITFQLFSMQSERVVLGVSMALVNRVNKKMGEEKEDVRFVIWRGLFRMLEERGYWGLGIGQFKANFKQYYVNESNPLITEIVNRGYYLSPHNDYLAILADYGLPSLLFYLTFLFVSFRKVFRKILYPTEDVEGNFLAQYAFMIFCCLIVYGMSAENFQHQLYWFLLMFSTKDQ